MSALVDVVVAIVSGAAFVVALLVGFIVGAYARRVVWDRSTAAPARSRPTCGLLLREARAIARIVSWSFRRRRDDDARGARDVVVLVHGMAADGSCMTHWARALASLGVRVVAPDHGMWLAPLEVHADRLATFVGRLVAGASTPPRLHFVGHSMGGVVVRAMLAACPDVARLTSSVTTVATPHAGSAGGRGLPWSRIARLTTGSPLFASLPSLAALVPDAIRATLGAVDDAVVYPLSTTHDEDDRLAVRHDVAGIGHASLLVDERVSSFIAGTVGRALSGRVRPPDVDG
jgi:pimeloyl-ACP methyl ester carboxylesterase